MAEEDLLNATLGVFSHHQKGEQIGTIKLVNGRIRGSTSQIQNIIDSRIRRYDGNAQKAWDSFDNWSNGYLWVKPIAMS